MVILSKPFRGTWYYEWQVGPLVIQWQHDLTLNPTHRWRLHLWLDSMWLMH